MAITYASTKCFSCRSWITVTGPDQFVCAECVTRLTSDRAREEIARLRSDFIGEKERAWTKLCPPLYRVSDRARLPAAAVAAIDEYTFGPVGLGLIGPARIGKTRTMFQLLHRLVLTEGRRNGLYIYGPDFSSEVAGRGHEFSKFLKDYLNCSFLFFDDIGAGRFTPAVESNFLLLLETRASYELPTFWTSNVGPNGLAAMLSPENGPRVIGRLGDFSTVVDL